METSARVEPERPLLVVGGDLALDLANTVDDPWGPARFDHLADLAGLIGWARLVGLLDEEGARSLLAGLEPSGSRGRAYVERAGTLRHAVGLVLGAVVDGVPPQPEAWHTLRAAVADAVAHASITVEDGHVRLGWPDDLDGVLHRVAYAAHQLLTGDQLHRVKRCAACPWLYVDRSKNLSRRWCTMDDCGKNEKMRRYVERRATRRAAQRVPSAAAPPP